MGIGAAIAIGAGLGAAGNLIDQWVSGYPINLGEVALSGALGGLGGGIGAAANGTLGPAVGNALRRLGGNTPIGRRFVQGGIGGISGGISGFVTGGIGALATGGDFWQGAWSGARDGGVTGFAGGAIAKTKPRRYGPMRNGPLNASDTATFRSGSYNEGYSEGGFEDVE